MLYGVGIPVFVLVAIQGETKGFFFQSLCPVGSLSKDLGSCSPHGLDAHSDSLMVTGDCTGQDLVPVVVLVDAFSASGGRV